MSVRRTLARSSALTDLAYRVFQSRARLAPAGAPPRVLVNSFPKAGTHLVMTALDHYPGMRFSGIFLPQPPITNVAVDADTAAAQEREWERVEASLERAKPGQYVTAHFHPAPRFLEILEKLGYRTVFVCRDPRDIVVSTALYFSRLRRHPHHRRFAEGHGSDKERMLAVITGFGGDQTGPAMAGLGPRLQWYLPWMQAPSTLPCRFEDLVGERGGGSSEEQLRALRDIGRHINRPLTDEMAADIARRTWSTKTTTFRGGVGGAWRAHFDDDLRQEFSREVGDELLAAYGYEADP
ncbi:MAG: hypothetical protein ACRDKX_02225 [Solirubrobacterales bacterium]